MAKKIWNSLLLSQNGNRRLVYALFMLFILGGTVVMQIMVTGFPRDLERFVYVLNSISVFTM